MRLRKSAPHIISVTLVLLLCTNATLWAQGGSNSGPQDLGTLGGSISQASSVDALAGHVTGSSTTTGDAATHATIWELRRGAVSIIDLGVLDGGTNSFATGTTSQRVATGTSDYNDPVYGVVSRAFLYQDSVLSMLGTLGGSQSQGTGINESNQVVGYSTITNDAATHAFFYDPYVGVLTDLGTLGGTNSQALAINGFGLVAGYSDTGNFDQYGNPISDAAIWDTRNSRGVTVVDLGTLGGTYAQANAINVFGQATGYSTLASGQTDAFLYVGGKMMDLGTLGGSYAQGLAINDYGVIVGYSNTTGDTATDAFIWTPAKGMVDLNSLLPAGSPWVLQVANGINDEGRIVGYGTINGEFHAFIW